MKAQNFLLQTICCLLNFTTICNAQYNYPLTKRIPVTDTYFGKRVTDNYRWLENMNDPEVKRWFKAQGDYTDSILNRIPGRDSLINDWLALDKLQPERRSDFQMQNDRYFYLLQKAEENVSKLFYRPGKNGKEILLFDPTTFTGNKGKVYSISYFLVNNQGNKVAIGVSQGGAEVATIRILDVDTKRFYPESIYPSWFGVNGWSKDGSSFFYNLQKTDNQNSPDFILNTKEMLHIVGADSKTDKEIFSREKYPDLSITPEDRPYVNFSEDNKYMVARLIGAKKERNIFYAPASEINDSLIHWKKLFSIDDDVTDWSFYNDKLYMLSHKNASNYQLLVTDPNNLDVANAKVVVAQNAEKIESIHRSKDYLFLTMTDGINNDLLQLNLKTGKIDSIRLPQRAQSTITAYNPRSNETLITSTTWNLPNTFYDYNANKKHLTKSIFQIDVKYPGLENIVVKEVEAPGYDGTMIPLSIVYRRDLKMDGNNSCVLGGYGAYGNSALPDFNFKQLAFENKGIVIAIAHVRGGGEKGEAWHLAGYKTTKPNTWKDFISCAEYLIANGYTSPKKLAGVGSSMGGILIGRAITERPDLFAAALCDAGVANALRYEKTPNGPNSARELGISTDSVEAMALIEMDAVSHAKDGVKYPALICSIGMNDARVPPWESGKFAAALQNASLSDKPVLLRVDYNSGHLLSDEKMVSYKRTADIFGFLLWQCGDKDFQPK